MNAYQVRASVAAWLEGALPLDVSLSPPDAVTHQAVDGYNDNEWRITWDKERGDSSDQGQSRLVQVDRHRADGDEIALEKELVQALNNMELAALGRSALVPVMRQYDNDMTVIGHARVKRFQNEGWTPLPDPSQRKGFIRASLTLQVEYVVS